MKEWIEAHCKRIDWKVPHEEIELSLEFQKQYNDMEDEVFRRVKDELQDTNELIFKSDKFNI